MGMIVSWMLVAAAIGAFAVTALSGCFVIPALHKLHFGQTIRESGPTWHNKKQGTPTMGGLCFIFGILGACLPGKSLSCSSLLPAASWWGCTCRAC